MSANDKEFLDKISMTKYPQHNRRLLEALGYMIKLR